MATPIRNVDPAQSIHPGANPPVPGPVVNTATRTQSLIDNAEITLSERVDPNPQEVDTVRITGLQLGDKTLTFDFSVKIRGIRTPSEEDKLEELAIGCKRSLENTFAAKRSQLIRLKAEIRSREQQNKRVPKKLTKALEQVQKEMNALQNITSFTFKPDLDKHILVINGISNDEKVTVKIDLDPTFNGVANALRHTTERLESLKDTKQSKVDQILNLQKQMNAIDERAQVLADNGSPLPDDHAIFAQREELERTFNSSQETLARLEQDILMINKQLAALRARNLHEVEVVRERVEGTSDFVYVPRLKLQIRTDHTEEEIEQSELDEAAETLERYVVMHLPLIEPRAVIHSGGEVLTNHHLFNKTVQTVERAKKRQSPMSQDFQNKLAKKENPKGSTNTRPMNTGITPAQQALLNQRNLDQSQLAMMQNRAVAAQS